MKKKPEIGQTLYSLNIGNRARYGEQKLTPMVVTKIGKKYFTLENDGFEVQFYLNSWKQKTNYCQDHKLYETEQEYSDEKEGGDLCKKIFDAFRYGENTSQLTLSDLRKIDKILKNYDLN